MSDRIAATPPGDSPVKRRQPVERALVWGLIAVLFVLAFVETWSRYSYQRAYDSLGHRLEVGDEHSAEALDAGDVNDFLGGRQPSRMEDFTLAGKSMPNGATHLEVFTWFTFNPIHRREMYVYYDAFGPAGKDHPQVLSIQAVEEEFVPLISQREQQAVDRMEKEGTGPKGNMFPELPGMRGMPGMGPPGGRDVRLRGTKPAAAQGDKPADEPGQGSKPETDPIEL